MKKIFHIALIFLLSFSISSQLRAECKVENINLQRDSIFTKLTIYADVPFEYEHFTIEPKEGELYRVVVDIEDAIHRLPQNNFWNIPGGTITAIRTSQFTVEPSKTVRIVMDVKSPIVYRTEKGKENELSLIISTPGDSDFPLWAANMSPFKEGEVKLAQVEKKEPRKEQPKPQKEKLVKKENGELAKRETKTAEKKKEVKLAQATPKKKEVKTVGTKQVSPIQTKKENIARKETAKKVEKKIKEKIPSKSKVVEEKKKSKAKEPITVGKTEETKPQAEVSAPETSKVAQLKKKVEDKAKSIKKQVKRIKPRGQVIETVYKRRVVTYQSNGRKDPFTPIGEQINIEFGKTPVPAYESLKLVGILKDASGNMALLEDGEGYGYIMREGDKVRNGEVIYVGEDRLLFQITEYGWSKTVSIELFKE